MTKDPLTRRRSPVADSRRTGGDFFQPLSFDLRTKDKPPQDLFVQVLHRTFRTRPTGPSILIARSVPRRLSYRLTPLVHAPLRADVWQAARFAAGPGLGGRGSSAR